VKAGRSVALVALAGTLAVTHAASGEGGSSGANSAPRGDELGRSLALRTSLVWIFGDDDVLHAPGASTPPSPAASIGDRPGYDELLAGQSSRFTGRENRSELDVEGVAPGFLRGWDTRARLALALDASSLATRGAPVYVEDAGSFVEARFTFGGARSGRSNSLTLRAFPLNGDRERVGALEALAWGGASGPAWDSPYAAAHGPVRAVRLELAAGFAILRVALKTASFVEPSAAGPSVDETSYGVFGGVASRWSAPVAVALDFGHFEHGRLPGGVSSPRATTTGASLRFHGGSGFDEPLPPSGFGLERSPFDAVPAQSAGESGFAWSLEGAHLVERLWDFDRSGASTLAPARALAALAELRAGVFDVRAIVLLRDPNFVMRDGPGVFPGQALPRAAETRSELGVALGASAALGRIARPMLSAGVLAPAAVMIGAVDRAGQATGATFVVRGPGDVDTLPPGESPVPVVEARPGLTLVLSRLLEGSAWLDYRRDFNRTRLVAAPGGALARGFRAPDRVGYGLAARAVW
jgi:hypothetical protein